MSGRGRGRGRGRSAPSGARLLLQRSAQEAGLGATSLKTIQDITRPQLFPDYEWHSSGRQLHQPQAAPTRSEQQKSASTLYLIRKSRDIHHRFQNSPYYVRPTQEVDVNRYGKRQRPLEPDVFFLSQIGKTTDHCFFPPELLRTNAASAGDVNDGHSKKVLSLEEIAAAELKKRQAAAETNDDGDDPDLFPKEEDEVEEVDDYITNYYASDDESEEEGGEPTF
eukprot:scaffold25729_cov137-Cylindrotheca_fusiformis.AAC.4